MSWIKNKKTGVISECVNNDVIKICKKDTEGYEVAEYYNNLSSDKVENDKSPEVKDLKKMKLPELKEYALAQGIEVDDGLTIKEILALLGE